MAGKVTLTGAVQTFLFEKASDGLSRHTIDFYRRTLRLYTDWSKDIALSDVTAEQVKTFNLFMQRDYRIVRAGKPTDRQPAKRTLSHVVNVLITFWTWAAFHYTIPNPCTLKRLKVNKDPIEPLTEDEVSRLLRACEYRVVRGDSTRRSYEARRNTSKRDHALILSLLDTGCRISEICDAKIADLDTESGKITVTGKGSKTRHVYLGKKARSAVWAYLMERFPHGKFDQDAPLFLDNLGISPMNRDSARHLLDNLGRRARVTGVHPHRFRHTFAVEFLRNGGDVFTLQELLGHTTLTMVRRYVHLANIDMERVHRRASPSDNWRIR